MFRALRNVLDHPLNKNRKLKALATALWWKCNQTFFHLPALVKITGKFSIICHPNSSFGGYIVYARWPEYNETNFLITYLQPSDVYVDIGAHIGSELLVAASKVTKGKLFGFEPTPDTYEQLVTNLKLNNLESRIQVKPAAVSDKNGSASFSIESSSETNHLSEQTKNKSTVSVKTVTLDRFAKSKQLKRINVLKVDTEGAELKVFKGAIGLLKKQKIEVILFEINKHIEFYGSSIRELLEFIEGHNFQLYMFEHGTLKRIKAKDFTYTKTINLVAALKTGALKKRLKNLL